MNCLLKISLHLHFFNNKLFDHIMTLLSNYTKYWQLLNFFPLSQHGIYKSGEEKVTKVSIFHHFSSVSVSLSVSPFSLSLFIEKRFPASLADVGCHPWADDLWTSNPSFSFPGSRNAGSAASPPGSYFPLFITSYESSFAHILLKVQISKAIEKWVLFSHVTMTNNIIFAE